MKEVFEWIKIGLGIALGLLALIPVIVLIVQTVKKSIEEKNFAPILDLVTTLMSVAEESSASGAEKKDYVINAVKKVSEENDLNVDIDKVSTMIDSICAASKLINIKTEEKSEVEVTEDKVTIKEEAKTEIVIKEEEEVKLPTKEEILNKFVSVVKKEAPYYGHESGANLDDSLNCGAGGLYTKFARDLDDISYFNGKKQGYAWCCVMVCWLYYQACSKNKELTLKLLGQPSSGNYGAGTGPLCRYLTKVEPRTLDDCQVGDIVAYNYDDDEDIDHVGVIYKKDSKWIYVAQGNAVSVGPKGGFDVCFIHSATHKNVCGIYRPHWEVLQ